MAIWKEIRKAINSTLGTREFKPLDKMIMGSYELVANTGHQLLTFHSGSKEFYYGNPVTTKKCKFNTDGTICIKVKCNRSFNQSISNYIVIDVKKMDSSGSVSTVYSTQMSYGSFDDNGKGTSISGVIEVKKGDSFFVTCSSSSSNVSGYLEEASVFANYINNDIISIVD